VLGQNEQLQAFQDRFRFLYIILGIMVVLLSSRLWYLQIFRGDEFKQFAEENRLKKMKIAAPRGMIFDRNRRLLLDNQPTFSVEITPQYFRAASDVEQKAAVEILATILKIPTKQIDDILYRNRRQPSFQPVGIKKNLSMDEVALIEMEKLSLPGIDVSVGIRRTNVHGQVGAQLLGYIAEIDSDELPKVNRIATDLQYSQGDAIGKMGLEQQWEKVLRGENGTEYIEVDAYGRKKQNVNPRKGDVVADIPPKPAVPGKNLVLTIDEDVQIAAAEAFGPDKTGAVVAIDPNNGEVISMLSWPSFDSTEFSVGISPEYWKKLSTDDNKPLRDKTIFDHYSPGSTFKIISALAGLEEGLINRQTVINAGGSFKFGGRVFHDWKKEGHGPTDVVKSLYRSVDVFFYRLATRLDIDVLARYAKNLGLGSRTGISLPGEVPGTVPSTEWKKRVSGTEWYPGETLSTIIGQGPLDVTPLQLANMIAAVANGGTLYRPRLVKFVENQDGSVLDRTQPEIIRQARFSDESLKLVREGLEDVVSHPNGTAHSVFTPGIRIAGKTGTAQVVKFSADAVYKECTRLERRFRHHGLFVAYAPVENPKIAVAVVAEHACHGTTAAPIAMAVIKKYLSKLNPEKYGEEPLKEARAKFWKTTHPSVGGNVDGD
jgi:penicillin-binding protein 2